MRIKTLIKNILPYFIVDRYTRKVPLPSMTMDNFELNFKEKAQLLADHRFSCTWEDRFPCLDDNTEDTKYEPHYLYHPAWATRILANTLPKLHIDIGSSLHFITCVSAFIPIKFYDIRPASINLTNLQTGSADITKLPFDDNSIESLSSMHVVEHIGLERYGDSFDPQGDLKGIHELQRVLKQEGNLLFVVPVGGKMRIQYNAHRIYTFESIIKYFSQCKLLSYTLITDDGQYLEYADSKITAKQRFGCGCFLFTKEVK